MGYRRIEVVRRLVHVGHHNLGVILRVAEAAAVVGVEVVARHNEVGRAWRARDAAAVDAVHTEARVEGYLDAGRA